MYLFSKVKKVYITTLLLILCFTSCHRAIHSRDEIIVDSIRKENNFDLAKRGLVRITVGDAYNPTQNTIHENYQTRKIQFSTMDDARAFFLSVYNDYSKPFAHDKRLKPVEIELQITFIDTRANPLLPPKIARMRNEGRTLHFYSYEDNTKRFMPIAQEPF